MRNFIPNWFFGAMMGLSVAVLAWTGLSFFGLPLPRLGSLAFDAVGIVFGAYVGNRGGPILRPCAAMAAVLGVIGFALGFVGPLLFTPYSPQGPLLGIFVTGPWAIIVGALLGLLMGVAHDRHGRGNGAARNVTTG
jgi:hypothetical protein